VVGCYRPGREFTGVGRGSSAHLQRRSGVTVRRLKATSGCRYHERAQPGLSSATTAPRLDQTSAPGTDQRPSFLGTVSRTRLQRAVVPTGGAVIVTLIACWYFRVWDGGLGTPITYSGDALFYTGITNSIIGHGWYFTNSNLGAPLGQVTYDYPLGSDNLNLVVIRVLAWISTNPFVVNNLFLYLTFPATFLTSWFVLRRLGFSKAAAWVTSIVYVILPYHFWRADIHLMLAAYYAVPLGALLVYEFIGAPSKAGTRDAGQELFTGAWRARVVRFIRSRWLWIPVVLGSAGVYYGAFFVYLALTAGGLTALRDRDFRRLALPAICSVVVVAVLAINNSPSLFYWARHGRNAEAVERPLGQNDTFGLDISYLVLPINNHRLPLFRHTKERLTQDSESPVPDMENQGLGLLASVGLVVSLGSLLIGVTNRRSDGRWAAFRRRSGELNLFAILLATVGGLSTILGLLGFTWLRAYSRISIYIAFFSLVALGAVCETWLARRKAGSRRGRSFTAIIVALSLAVCAFAIYDQTPREITFPGQLVRSQVKARLASDRTFAKTIDRRLGPGAMVFELPLMESPEAGLPAKNRKLQYFTDELVKPSLFTNDLRWSWGAAKGRPHDLTPSFVGRPLERLLPDLAVLGFDGIYIDRRGFEDHGTQIEAGLASILDGRQPIVSRDGGLSFFDLRPYAKQYKEGLPAGTVLAQRSSALNPLRLDWGRGFSAAAGLGQFYPALEGVAFGRSAENDAVLDVTNPLQATRRMTLHFAATSADMQPATLEVRTPRGTQRFNLASSSAPALELNVPPGTTRLTFRIDRRAPGNLDDPKVAFQIFNPWWEAPLVPGKPG
jgi:phosphoglycerol transferase